MSSTFLVSNAGDGLRFATTKIVAGAEFCQFGKFDHSLVRVSRGKDVSGRPGPHSSFWLMQGTTAAHTTYLKAFLRPTTKTSSRDRSNPGPWQLQQFHVLPLCNSQMAPRRYQSVVLG